MEWLKKIRHRWHEDIVQRNEDLKETLLFEIRTQADRVIDQNAPNSPADSGSKPRFQISGPDFYYEKNTYFGTPCRVWHPETKVGAFCSIAWDVNIGTTHHPTNWLSTHIFSYSRRPDLYDIVVPEENLKQFMFFEPVEIGNDVWIGCDVTILDGIHIGDGAVIGAGSIVTKDVPPYAIVAGSPAKIIRYRFDKNTIEELEALKWWELDDSIIATLSFDNVPACIEQLKKIRS